MNEKAWFYFYVGMVIVGVILTFVWIKQPSSFNLSSGDTEYTKCLGLVLNHGSISDAETMCSDRKTKVDK